jgi:hypothetical protein
MIFGPSKGKFEVISIPIISDSFTLLITNGVHFPILDGQTTCSKPLIFLEYDFSTIFNLPPKTYFSCFGSPQHSFPKRRALFVVWHVSLIFSINNCPPKLIVRVLISLNSRGQEAEIHIPQVWDFQAPMLFFLGQ